MKSETLDTSTLKHLTIPGTLVLILTVLLIPLPTTLLDVFIACNITISFIVLFVSLYMERALMFTSFPALLLLTTLFRMSMGIAATRLILLNGHEGTEAAGHVIKAFGEFVIGGNYVIGVVVYLAISIINLRVITKGTGRIAEVAARFTLDAMPGKQVAIDSDLNIGLISESEAKVRRKELQMEAEFYGAMDGAAKFVQGDASATVFITGINILGGLFVGIIQKGMNWLLALQTYTLLTIGDGLVAQIPAVIISTASGLIVARAASGEDLNAEVLGQLTKSNKPLYLACGVCAALALVPGLPFFPFITLSAITGSLGFVQKNFAKKEADKKAQEEKKQKEKTKPSPGSTEEVTGLLGIDSLELEVGYELVSMVEGGDLVERIRSLRRQFAMDYGFIVPPIHIRDNVRIKPGEYRFMLRGALIGSGELKARHLLAMDPGNANQEVQGIKTKEPAFGLDALWINEADKERAQFAGFTVVDLSTVITTHLTEMVRSNMDELIGRQEVQHLIDNVRKDAPKVVEELIPGLLTLGQVQQVLAHLLREQVSIRDLRSILETLADWAPTIKSPERLAEYVRKKLCRTITSKYVSAEGVMPLASLSPQVERVLTDSLQQSDEGSYVALEPAFAQQLISRLNKVAEKFIENGQTPVILASSHVRAALFSFVRRFVPGVGVISHQEIAPNTRVQSLGVISVE